MRGDIQPASWLDQHAAPSPLFLLLFLPAHAAAAGFAADQQSVCDLRHGCFGEKQAKNRPNETILPKPRNDPETDGAYLSRQQGRGRCPGGIT
jgi:hypothetical protein